MSTKDILKCCRKEITLNSKKSSTCHENNADREMTERILKLSSNSHSVQIHLKFILSQISVRKKKVGQNISPFCRLIHQSVQVRQTPESHLNSAFRRLEQVNCQVRKSLSLILSLYRTMKKAGKRR